MNRMAKVAWLQKGNSKSTIFFISIYNTLYKYYILLLPCYLTYPISKEAPKNDPINLPPGSYQNKNKSQVTRVIR